MGFISKLFELFNLQTKKQESAKKIVSESEIKKNVHGAEIKFKTTIESSTYKLVVELGEGEKISLLNLNGYVSPSGGYVNWARFQVVGVNSKTNRKNTKYYEAKDTDAARALAMADGLNEPFIIQAVPHAPEINIEHHIDYLRDSNFIAPKEAIKADLLAIRSRIYDSDDVISEVMQSETLCIRTVRAKKAPSEEFALYAHESGVKFSKYISEEMLYYTAINSLAEKDKIALFAYYILSSRRDKTLGDLRKDDDASKFYEFATISMQDSGFLQSVKNMALDKYMEPNKRTKAYKAIVDFFEVK